MTKKCLILGLLAFSTSLNAENFPTVTVVGSNPSTGVVATLETLVEDPSADVVVGLKILDKYHVIYDARVTESIQQTEGDVTESDLLRVATERVLRANADKLVQYGIDQSEKGTLLYAHPRKNYSEGGPNYDFATELKLGADKNFELSVKKTTDQVDSGYVSWSVSFFDSKNPTQPAQDLWVYGLQKSDENLEGLANVGFQQVYQMKSDDGGRLLVLSSYQTFGFEGPDTSFVYSMFNIVNKD